METAIESPLSEGLSINPADSSGNSCTTLASPSSSIKSGYSSSSDSSCKSESLHKSGKRVVTDPQEKSQRNPDQGYPTGKVANCSNTTAIESVSSISSTSPPRSPDSASILRHSSSLPRNHSYSPLIHHSNHNIYNNQYANNSNPNRTVPCLVLSPNAHGFFNPNSFYNPSQLLLPVPVFHSTMMGKMSALSSKNFDSGINRFKDFGMDANFTNTYEFSVGRDSKEDIISGRRREKHGQSESNSFEQPKKLSFGMDRILSDENSKPDMSKKKVLEKPHRPRSRSPDSAKVESSKVQNPAEPALIPTSFHPHHPHAHHHPQFHNDPHHPSSISNNTTSHIISNHPPSHNNNSGSPINLSRCTECYLVGRYCRNNNLQYSSLVSCGATPGGPANGVSASFAPWMTSASMYENSPLLSPSAYAHLPQSALPSAYGLSSSGFSTMSSLVSCNSGSGGRRKRSWSRAVFSSLQRKGLEKRFQIQKYITKPDRRQLAATLGLTDAQVKVWFQNRRMKWRHSKEGKVTSGVGDEGISLSTASSTTSANGPISTTYSSSDKK